MIRLNKTTRYALYAVMEMARPDQVGQVTAAQVARRYSIPPSVLAKVFPQLVRRGLALGTRGSGGGYRLTRKPSELTVLEVVEAFEPPRAPGHCLLDDDERRCGLPADCRLRGLFDEVDEMTRCTFASITLETLVCRPRPGIGPWVAGSAS